MTLIELPRRAAPRLFVEPPPDLERRVKRALRALGELADLPGLQPLAEALIGLADALEPDADLEPEDEADGEEELLPLFAYAARAGPP